MTTRKSSKPSTFAGIDVSAKTLEVALVRRGGSIVHLTIDNDPKGHKVLIRALRKGHRGLCRVVLEATGNYHLDLALLLAHTDVIELMVVNPMAARRFAQAQMRRAKTDKVDAVSLLDFAQRMLFEAWRPPSEAALEFRAVTRYLHSLTTDQTAIKNRLTATIATMSTPDYVTSDLKDQLQALAKRIAACQVEAEALARADHELSQLLDSLISMPGTAERSGVKILGELLVLDPSMTPDQVVAHAGLDPRPRQSGLRDGKRTISKVGNARLRAALYLPAVTAARCDPAVAAWYTSLRDREKPPHLAHTAVMRRMLRVAWVLITGKTTWNADLFLPRNRSHASQTAEKINATP